MTTKTKAVATKEVANSNGKQTHITIEQLRSCAPLSMRKHITQKHIDLLNSDLDDSDLRDEIREHIFSWVNVMQEGKWRVKDYLNAVKFVTYKLTGDTSISAWSKVFPDKFQRLVDMGKESKVISSHVAMYNRTDLVQKICERTLPLLHVLNSDLLQEAINVQASLMRSAKSEAVQQKSSATLIEFLRPPESIKVDMNVGVSNDTVEDLRAVTRALAVQQAKAIKSGDMTAKGVAEMDIISRNKPEEIIDAEFKTMDEKPKKRTSPLQDFFQSAK